MGVNRIASSLASRMDVLLLIQITGSYEAGIYGAANRLAIGVPLILGSFATVLAPRFASISNKDELLIFLRRSMGISALITFGLIFGVLVAPFVIFLFGPAYSDSSAVLQLLFISFIPSAISVPAVNFVIYSLKKPQIITAVSFLQLPIIVLVNVLFIPKIGPFAPAVALGLANLLMMISVFFITWKELRNKI